MSVLELDNGFGGIKVGKSKKGFSFSVLSSNNPKLPRLKQFEFCYPRI
jgi:hypothetical protein